MPNLPDIVIGEKVHVGCKSCALGSSCYNGRSDWCPNNGEWTNFGDNSYNCSVGKHKFYCKRQSYNADPLQCCMRNATTVLGKTCDPQYRSSTNSSCTSLLINHCEKPSNAFSAVCSQFIKDLAETQPGTVNRIAGNVCTGSNADRPECACYSAKVPDGLKDNRAAAIYRCLDADCQAPDAWNTNRCNIAFTQCNIEDPTILINESTLNKIKIANECGNICIDCDLDDPDNEEPVETPQPTKPLDFTPIIIGGAAIVVILLIIMILTLGVKKK